MSMYAEGIEIITDTALNDSDKTLTPAASVGHKLLGVSVNLITTAVAGNRIMRIEIRDDTDAVIQRFDVNVAQAASLTYDYIFSPGGSHSASSITNSVSIGLPIEVLLLPGWDIRVYDRAAIDAAADDMEVRAVFENLSRLN